MLKQSTHIQKIAGFTLIELMISVAIGFFLMAGVFTVFSNGRQAQAVIDGQTQLIDDARFAFTSISYDLRHAGLWGKTNNYKEIAGTVYDVDGTQTESPIPRQGTAAIPVIAGDCEASWYRNLSESFFVANNVNPYLTTCIPNGSYQANTDVLVVKYAPPTAIASTSLAANIVYILSNSFQGELFVGDTQPDWDNDIAGLVASNYRLKARAYFVNTFTDVSGDGYPSLHRIELSVGPSLTDSMLIPGVEDFQLQLGLDMNNDGSVDMYVDADDARLEWDYVTTVQFWVMVRSRDGMLRPADIANGVAAETQTISMAGRAATTFSDGFKRVVMSTVVKLQNRLAVSDRAGS